MKKEGISAQDPSEKQQTTQPIAKSAAIAGIQRLTLAKVRALSGMTQKEIATKLGIKQNNISRLESRNDMHLSTLKKYLSIMNAEFEVIARVNGKIVLIDFNSLS